MPGIESFALIHIQMDATPLDQLMPPGGSQQPAMSLPSATTYPQMITPGTSAAKGLSGSAESVIGWAAS
jgi:hypothetical protein